MSTRSIPHVTVLAVALAMLAVPMQAAATHNSFGGHLEITRGDEVEPGTGTLMPDVPEGEHVDDLANVYQKDFYNRHDELPVREGPSDQSGAFYDPETCTGFAEIGDEGEGTRLERYEDALPNHDHAHVEGNPEDACYVGYLDTQIEYIFGGTLFFQPQPDTDPLYFLNPAPEDDECEHGDYFVSLVEDDGGERREGCGSPPGVSVFGVTVDPLPGGSTDHGTWWPGRTHMPAVDVDHVEGAFGGDDGANCQEATCQAGTDVPALFEEDGRDFHGSGTITLPHPTVETTFLFGYPHPDNPDAADYDFGPGDAPFSQTLWGVPDAACGERIPDGECQLLGPKDLKLYDKFAEASDLTADQRGRLCKFEPDLVGGVTGLAGGPCGIFGDEITTFVEDAEAGGFGTDTASTYQSTFPGWKQRIVTLGFTYVSPLFYPQQFTTDNSGEHLYEDGHEDYEAAVGTDEPVAGFTVLAKYFDRGITAVNPKVPNGDDPAYCVRPQILTDGEVAPGSGVNAPGVYGTYQAAAIDVDMYANGVSGPVTGGLHDGDGVPGYDGYHETFEPVLGPADALFGTANDALTEAGQTLEEAGDALPEDTPLDEEIDEATARVSALASAAGNASDRAGPTERSDPEPTNQVGPQNYDPFDDPIPAGMSCENGLPQFGDGEDTRKGALQFDAQVSRASTTSVFGVTVNTSLKDPTVSHEDETLPAREANTTDGTWQPDSYSFGGPLVAYVDTTGDEAFSGCATNSGQPQPNNDNCAWIGAWDAYNPSCQDSQANTCAEVLLEDGYVLYEDNVTAGPYGVGLVSTLEVSGTTLLWTSSGGPGEALDRWRLVNQDPGASTCVIMTSYGFEDRLATHLGDATGLHDPTFDREDRKALCPDHAGASAEDSRIEVWTDAFEDQGGPESNGFAATVNWAKLTPTPDAAREATDARDDRICLTSVFSTSSDVLAENTATGDKPGVSGTKSNIQLGAESTTTYYTDCDVLTSEAPDDRPPTDGHPLDVKTHAFPDYGTRR